MVQRAFWVTMRRLTIIGASVDLVFFIFFYLIGSALLAWVNVVSVSLYASAYWLIARHKGSLALVPVWIEVLGHAAVGSLLAGWDSGFHYYILLFIPGIFVATRTRSALWLSGTLLLFYLGLHAACQYVGILEPMDRKWLLLLHAFNVTATFAILGSAARFYYGKVRSAERKLHDIARTDPLSGLFNRRHFLEASEIEMSRAKRNGHPVALMIADIDHFKQVNDQHGHESGDKVIKLVSHHLQKACRKEDIVARWGGEEFILMLPATDMAATQQLAERIRKEIMNARIDVHGKALGVTVSIGIAQVSANEAIDSAVARADAALYQSKAQGRNRVSVTVLNPPVSVADEPPLTSA